MNENEKTAVKKSWRDVYKVHPAADLFPMLTLSFFGGVTMKTIGSTFVWILLVLVFAQACAAH